MNVRLLTRLAEPDEREMLETLQRQASLANEHDRAALLANPGAIALPIEQIEARQVIVAERSGVVVGFAAIQHRHDGDVELDGLFVDPSVWRTGIGSALVQECVSQARLNGAPAIHVLGNRHAQRFYEACGFKTYEVENTEFGPALRMKVTV